MPVQGMERATEIVTDQVRLVSTVVSRVVSCLDPLHSPSCALVVSPELEKLAGMDGNRTHPGRLCSAPQTVLKTGGSPSASVHRRPLKFGQPLVHSADVRCRPPASASLAVFLAVRRLRGRGDDPKVQGPTPARALNASSGGALRVRGPRSQDSPFDSPRHHHHVWE